MKYLKGLMWLSALLLILAACGGQPAPQATQDDFDQSLSGYQTDAGEVASAVGQDLAVQAMKVFVSIGGDAPGIPSAGDLALAVGSLATGKLDDVSSLLTTVGQLTTGRYDYNPGTGDWDEDGSYGGDDLVLAWGFDDDGNASDYDTAPHKATLTFDWNYNGVEPVVAMNSSGGLTEVPQDAMITLDVDSSTNVGNLEFVAQWYYCDAVDSYILEPTDLTISGSLGVSDRITYNVGYNVDSNSMSTDGKIEVSADGDSASFEWNLTANGTLTRGEDCFVEDFDITGGHANFSTSATSDGETESLEFNTDYSLNMGESGVPESADLSNGYVKVNGSTAVTFAGTLDDSNNNCVPGENVTLNFADGSTNLEQYLIDQGVQPGCE